MIKLVVEELHAEGTVNKSQNGEKNHEDEVLHFVVIQGVDDGFGKGEILNAAQEQNALHDPHESQKVTLVVSVRSGRGKFYETADLNHKLDPIPSGFKEGDSRLKNSQGNLHK